MILDLNEQFTQTLDRMERGDKHLFITGKAGTGKSTLLDLFRNQTKKNIAVLAPTGVAAVNVRGQTIHSFFGFKPNITPEVAGQTKPGRGKGTLYTALDAIVIDEISMVRADLLDCIDAFLRLNRKDKYTPFGGVQMIFVGDLYQLPPVVTQNDKDYLATHYDGPYFFDSHVFASLTIEVVHLEKVYRQKDEMFITLLNKIRTNSASQLELAVLNNSYQEDPFFDPGGFYIFLTATNILADTINEQQLNRLVGKLISYEGALSGDFLAQNTPTHLHLALKIGAQVMLLNNDAQKRWVNGDIGKIMAIKKQAGNPDCIVVELTGGKKVEISSYTWEQYKFDVDDTTKKIMARTVGSFSQYPLKLAWAVTIHKSQGKTFDRVIIDVGRGTFAHGQMYVALSRCTTLKGVILKQPIQKHHLKTDPRVHGFMQHILANTVQEND